MLDLAPIRSVADVRRLLGAGLTPRPGTPTRPPERWVLELDAGGALLTLRLQPCDADNDATLGDPAWLLVATVADTPPPLGALQRLVARGARLVDALWLWPGGCVSARRALPDLRWRRAAFWTAPRDPSVRPNCLEPPAPWATMQPSVAAAWRTPPHRVRAKSPSPKRESAQASPVGAPAASAVTMNSKRGLARAANPVAPVTTASKRSD